MSNDLEEIIIFLSQVASKRSLYCVELWKWHSGVVQWKQKLFHKFQVQFTLKASAATCHFLKYSSENDCSGKDFQLSTKTLL